MSVINGTANNDDLNGTTGPDEINGDAGNDVLRGNNGADFLTGGAGDDTLYGGGGADRYIFNPGDGNDTIDNSGAANDLLVLGAGFSEFDIRLVKENDDLIITFTNSPADSIRIAKHYFSANFVVPFIRFANNHSLDISPSSLASQVYSLGSDGNDSLSGHQGRDFMSGQDGADLLYGYDGNDQLNGDAGADYLDGGAGADALFGWTGNDTLSGMAGEDYLYGDEGADVLLGGADADTLYGGNGEDSLTGGTGNDTLIGGGGQDSYYFDLGDGQDWIYNQDDIDGDGEIVLSSAFTEANVILTKNGNDLVITFTNSLTDSISISGHFYANYLALSAIRFADNHTLNIFPTSQAALIYSTGSEANDVLSGHQGRDAITGQGGADWLSGYGGNDLLNGDAGADYLDGGADADTMVGGAGNDTYIVDNKNDVVVESSTLPGDTDTVQSSVSYALTDTVENLELTGTNAIKGTGNSQNNILIGNYGNNVLTGGAGDDTLSGGNGIDRYVFNLGDGHDTIDNSNGSNDLLALGAGFSAVNTRLYREGNDLVITFIGNTADTIRIVDQYAEDPHLLSFIQFADGTKQNISPSNPGNIIYWKGTPGNDFLFRLDSKDVMEGFAGDDYLDGEGGNDTLDGGEGNDYLDGGSGRDLLIGGAGDDFLDGWDEGADTLIGGVGDDTLTGGEGADTYIFNMGDGNDFISWSQNDLLVLGAGFSAANLQLSRTHSEVKVSFIGHAADSLMVSSLHVPWVLDAFWILFADGSKLNIGPNNLANTIYQAGSAAGDFMQSFFGGKDVMEGYAGDDYMEGAGGNDQMDGGDGNDYLVGGAGIDVMKGGLGNDIYDVDSAFDKVIESADSGFDEVHSSVSYTLSANIEALGLTGTAAINGTGNSLSNMLYGNSGANILNGGLGADTLTGRLGNDTYLVARNGGADTIVENDATVGNSDTLQLTGASIYQLWFSHVGNNLEVSIIGTNDKVVVQDWYSGSAQHVEQIKTVTGSKTLLDGNVENLVTAMASITPPPVGQIGLTAQQHAQLDGVIAANWS